MKSKSILKPAAPKTDGLPPEVAALVAQGDEQAVGKLAALAAGPDRATAKAARRGLYLLKQAGVAVPTEAAAVPNAAARSTAAQQGFLSNPDGNGGQMLVFVQEDPHGGSPWLITFLVNFSLGLRDLGGNKMSRREIAQSFEEMRAKPNRYLVEVPVDYARQRLQEAVAHNREDSRPIPQGYAALLERVGLPERTWERSLVYDYMDADAVRADQSYSRDPDKLFEDDLFRGWLINLQSVAPWLERLYEAYQSPLALDENQKRQRDERIIDEAADDLLADGGAAIYRKLLEETALVLHLAGREELARQALFHALSMEDDKSPHEVPFLRALASRSIYVLAAIYAREEEQREQREKEARELQNQLRGRVY